METTNYILAGWLIDGGSGPVQEKMLLTVEDGRFTKVAPYDEGQLPAGATLTDLSHCTILLPLVDSHVHLFISGTTDRLARERQLVADYDELRPTIARHLHHLYSHGVLAIRDGGDRSGFAGRYRAARSWSMPMVRSRYGAPSRAAFSWAATTWPAWRIRAFFGCRPPLR